MDFGLLDDGVVGAWESEIDDIKVDLWVHITVEFHHLLNRSVGRRDCCKHSAQSPTPPSESSRWSYYLLPQEKLTDNDSIPRHPFNIL